jgi:uncharacterized repeat protein (TIGR01451 family)
LVTLNKSTGVSAINPGDTVTVTVTAKNIGSTPTKVFITDHLPAKTTLISGITDYEEFLEAGKEVNFSYTLKVDSDTAIELPPATAQYYESGTKGTMINTSSQKLELMIKSSTEANVTPTKIQPSIESKNNYTNSSAVNGSDERTYESGTNVSGTKGSGIFNFISKIIRAIVTIIGAGFDSINVTASSISFTDPTPANSATRTQNYTYISTTVSDASTAFIDWNHSLAGWWRFNEESGENSSFFRDWSSWGNNMTCSGTTCPVSISGKFGNALSFDGSDDYVSAGNIASGASGTMEAWIKSGESYTTNQYVMGGLTNDGTDATLRYVIFVRHTSNCASGDWGTNIANGSANQVVCSGQVYNSSNFPSGTWKHIAITYDGSFVIFYNDGTMIKTVAQTVNGAGNAQPFSIGRIGAYNGFYFNGNIDEVRIHNRALSSEEIKASYNAGIYRLYGNFTNLTNGVYNYKAYSQNVSGTVNQTETRTLTLTS